MTAATRDAYWHWLRTEPRMVRESMLFYIEVGHRPWFQCWARGRSS